MDKKQNDLVKYMAIGGAVAAGYYIVNYLASRSPKPKALKVQVTRRILKEVKYQMISNCITFANGSAQKLKSEKKERDLEIGLRTQLANLLQGREDAVLKKYQISRDQYSWSLEQHSKDNIVRGYTTQIMGMLEKAIKGQIPDLTVPEVIKRTFRDEESIQIYRGMIIDILQKLWEQIENYRKQNPNFNSKNDRQFQASLKGFSIYDIKVSFLQKKGYKQEWGCPNQLFLKVIETIKINRPQLKKITLKVERAYEKMMTQVTTNSQNLSKQRIQFSYKELEQENPVNPLNASLANRPQAQIIPKKVQNPFTTFNKAKLPPPPPKYNQEEELQRMMMQQLMNRSQQLPQEQKAQEVQVQQLPEKQKIQEVKSQENAQQLPEKQKIQEVQSQENIQQVKEQKIEQVEQPKQQTVNQPQQNVSEQPKPDVVEVAIADKIEENLQQVQKVDPVGENNEQINVTIPQEPEVAVPSDIKQAEITPPIEKIQKENSEQVKPSEIEQLKKEEASEEEKPVVENDHN